MEHERSHADEPELLCPHCVKPIGPFDHFCPHCNGPVTAHASVDPVGQVFAAGHAYQNATSKPKLIIVIGMWLIFSPQIPFLVFAFFGILSNIIWPRYLYHQSNDAFVKLVGSGLVTDLIKLAVVSGLVVLYVILLKKVTTRYLGWTRENRLQRRGRCGNCGYDMRGSLDGVRPECGTVNIQPETDLKQRHR